MDFIYYLDNRYILHLICIMPILYYMIVKIFKDFCKNREIKNKIVEELKDFIMDTEINNNFFRQYFRKDFNEFRNKFLEIVDEDIFNMKYRIFVKKVLENEKLDALLEDFANKIENYELIIFSNYKKLSRFIDLIKNEKYKGYAKLIMRKYEKEYTGRKNRYYGKELKDIFKDIFILLYNYKNIDNFKNKEINIVNNFSEDKILERLFSDWYMMRCMIEGKNFMDNEFYTFRGNNPERIYKIDILENKKWKKLV